MDQVELLLITCIGVLFSHVVYLMMHMYKQSSDSETEIKSEDRCSSESVSGGKPHATVTATKSEIIFNKKYQKTYDFEKAVERRDFGEMEGIPMMLFFLAEILAEGIETNKKFASDCRLSASATDKEEFIAEFFKNGYSRPNYEMNFGNYPKTVYSFVLKRCCRYYKLYGNEVEKYKSTNIYRFVKDLSIESGADSESDKTSDKRLRGDIHRLTDEHKTVISEMNEESMSNWSESGFLLFSFITKKFELQITDPRIGSFGYNNFMVLFGANFNLWGDGEEMDPEEHRIIERVANLFWFYMVEKVIKSPHPLTNQLLRMRFRPTSAILPQGSPHEQPEKSPQEQREEPPQGSPQGSPHEQAEDGEKVEGEEEYY